MIKRLLSPFVTLCIVGFFARLSYAMARTPILPLFALSLGAKPVAIGFLVGVSTITGVFFKLPAGTLSDIYGRHKMLLSSILFFALTPFAYNLVINYWQLLGIRFLHGLATSIYCPVVMALIVDTAGTHKSERLSWFSSITIIGSFLGTLLGGFVLYHMAKESAPSLVHFHIAYSICGLFGLVSLLFTFRFLTWGKKKIKRGKTSISQTCKKFSKGVREVISDYRVAIISNTSGIQNLSVGALEVFLPIYAVTIAGLNTFHIGILWGAQFVSTIFVKPIMGKISDRYGRKFIIFSGMWICAIPLACIPFTHDFFILFFLTFTFGIGKAFVSSSSSAMVAELCQEQNYGAAMGAFGSILNIGHASGPILAGLLLVHFSYQHSFLIIASILILAAFIFNLSIQEKSKSRTLSVG